jgi:small subunit ribosomal protein S9
MADKEQEQQVPDEPQSDEQQDEQGVQDQVDQSASEAPGTDAPKDEPVEDAEASTDVPEAGDETSEDDSAPHDDAPVAAESDKTEQAPERTMVELAADARYSATGKRKSAVARVIIRPGSGKFELNGRSLQQYFPRQALQAIVRHPLELAGYADRVDVRARIHGGGIAGQADAVRHGISRALIEADPALRGELKRRQLLTRDPRVKERYKAGLKKARKRPQFSKR